MTDAYARHRGELATLLDPRCHSIEWLDGEVYSGRLKTWSDDKAIIIVDVKMYPAGAREIHGMAAAGSLPNVLGLIEQAERWAKDQGIEFATIASREGWARVLEPRGYRPHQSVIRKEL